MEKYTSSENYLYMIHYYDPPVTIENFDNSVDYTILIVFYCFSLYLWNNFDYCYSLLL